MNTKTSRIFLKFLPVVFCLLLACQKVKVENPNSTAIETNPIVARFASQYLPAEIFSTLNWQKLRTVTIADSVFGWIVYPTTAHQEELTSYFIQSKNGLPSEIVSYFISSKSAVWSGTGRVAFKRKAFISGIERNDLIDYEKSRLESQQDNGGGISLMSLGDWSNGGTLPGVVIYGKKKRKPLYVNTISSYEGHPEPVYIPMFDEGDGGGGSGGDMDGNPDSEEIIDLSQFSDFTIYQGLYLFTPEEFPGKDVGLHWKWWLSGTDVGVENVDAAFFNLEHLKLDRNETLYAIANSELNRTIKQLLLESNLETKALIVGKITLRHGQFNLLDKPDNLQHIDIITATHNEFACCVDPVDRVLYKVYLNWRIVVLKQENPTWSHTRCYWAAHLDILQNGLDVAGLIPVFGEVCDITNGVIYTLRGDGINASLSFVAAVPIVGWWATAAKWATKTIHLANGTKTTLYWYRQANNVITFGSENSKQFRKILGLQAGDTRQAHHVIPWELANDGNQRVIQMAAQGKFPFHVQDVLNGIPISTIQHNGSHAAYTERVRQALRDINDLHGANLTPDIAFHELINLTNRIKNAILANPNTPINQLIF